MVVAETGREVEGVVEAGGDGPIGRVAEKSVEEKEGPGGVVPQALEDAINKVGRRVVVGGKEEMRRQSLAEIAGVAGVEEDEAGDDRARVPVSAFPLLMAVAS